MKKNYNDISWSFLLASPSLTDSIFEQSVILILEDDANGSLGVVVNKPKNLTLGEIAEDFENNFLSNIEVFFGGPVNAERLTLAIWSDDFVDGGFSFGLDPKKLEQILKKNSNSKACAFLGCSTWRAGQLQSEIDKGLWIVSQANFASISDISPDKIWTEMLLREVPKYADIPCPILNKNLN